MNIQTKFAASTDATERDLRSQIALWEYLLKLIPDGDIPAHIEALKDELREYAGEEVDPYQGDCDFGARHPDDGRSAL